MEAKRSRADASAATRLRSAQYGAAPGRASCACAGPADSASMRLISKLHPIILQLLSNADRAQLPSARLRNRNDDLLERIDVGLQRLLSSGNIIEVQDIRHDVQISLIVQASSPSRRHRIANGIEPLREGLSLPSELEGAIGQVGRLRFSAMEVGPVTARADSLVRRLSLLGLLLGKDAG